MFRNRRLLVTCAWQQLSHSELWLAKICRHGLTCRHVPLLEYRMQCNTCGPHNSMPLEACSDPTSQSYPHIDAFCMSWANIDNMYEVRSITYAPAALQSAATASGTHAAARAAPASAGASLQTPLSMRTVQARYRVAIAFTDRWLQHECTICPTCLSFERLGYWQQ